VPLSGNGTVWTVYFGAVLFWANVEAARVPRAITTAPMAINRLQIVPIAMISLLPVPRT
jgi:hypothetical protein